MITVSNSAPEGTISLHLGVPVKNGDLFEEVMENTAGVHELLLGGDGWKVWTDEPGREVDDTEMVHMIVRASPDRGVEDLVRGYINSGLVWALVPDGDDVVLNASDVWGAITDETA